TGTRGGEGPGAGAGVGRGRGKPGERAWRPALRAPPRAQWGGRGMLSGVLAFLGIAVGGGAGGYFLFFHQAEPAQAPVVAVERATAVETERPAPPPARPPEPAPPPAETPKPVEPEKAATPKPPEPQPHTPKPPNTQT